MVLFSHTDDANHLNESISALVQQMMSTSASYADRASAVSKSSTCMGLRVVDRVAMYVARNTLGLGVLECVVARESSES